MGIIMRLDPNPVYRKIITPWYDSELVSLVAIASMFLVFLFAMVGISVARETSEYHGYTWVPVLLVIMSTSVIVSITVRLIIRYMDTCEET